MAISTAGYTSPATTFKTLPGEVEVTGVQTQDERDAEAKKRAVDVDADDSDEPEAKQAGRGRRSARWPPRCV